MEEPYRQNGVGKALFEAVIDQAQHLGADELRWAVLEGNTNAEAFYRSLGGVNPIKSGM